MSCLSKKACVEREERRTDKSTRLYPGCGVRILKNGGCLSMMCDILRVAPLCYISPDLSSQVVLLSSEHHMEVFLFVSNRLPQVRNAASSFVGNAMQSTQLKRNIPGPPSWITSTVARTIGVRFWIRKNERSGSVASVNPSAESFCGELVLFSFPMSDLVRSPPKSRQKQLLVSVFDM